MAVRAAGSADTPEWATVKIITRLYATIAIMVAVGLGSAGLVVWSNKQIAFHQMRAELAHNVHHGYLRLSALTYRLFKEAGEASHLPASTQSYSAVSTAEELRDVIAEIRRNIGREIELVGEEELEELEWLERLETGIESLLAAYRTDAGPDRVDPATRWARMEVVLREGFGGDFESTIAALTGEEAEETSRVRSDTAALVVLYDQVAAFFAIFGIGATILWMGILIRDFRLPVAHVLAGAKAFSRGDLEHRIAVSGGPEIAEIALTLNRMADQVATREHELTETNAGLDRAVTERTGELTGILESLQRAEANRRRLLADVSHELRTPLTVIRGEADVALRGGEKSVQDYRMALTRTREMAVHTGQLVDDLLFVARKEAGEFRLNVQHFDLVDLMQSTAGAVSPGAGGGFTSITCETEMSEAMMQGDPARIRQVVAVLLDNALRYGDREIALRLDRSGDGFELQVRDDGPGMSEEERESAFERFYRGARAAVRSAEGVGLGLPVAKSIVEAHGGTIFIDSVLGEGTTVSVRLPQNTNLKVVA